MAGLREWFSQTDESRTVPRMPVMVNMTSNSASRKEQKIQENSIQPNPSVDQMHSARRHSVMLDEDSDEDEDYQISESEQEVGRLLPISFISWQPFSEYEHCNICRHMQSNLKMT